MSSNFNFSKQFVEIKFFVLLLFVLCSFPVLREILMKCHCHWNYLIFVAVLVVGVAFLKAVMLDMFSASIFIILFWNYFTFIRLSIHTYIAFVLRFLFFCFLFFGSGKDFTLLEALHSFFNNTLKSCFWEGNTLSWTKILSSLF